MATKAEPDETILASEVPRQLGRILSDLLRGKSFTIVRYGQPVGRIVATPPAEKGRK